MCGIAGVFSESYRMNENAALIQKHRGPDEYSCSISDHGQIFINRLAILDVFSGQQPMCNVDKSVHLVFNGEIFNSGVLRRYLEKQGKAFTTQNSDTEVILRGYEYWGTSVFEKLNGMFAVAIIDEENGLQILGRDTFGIKPLFYSLKDEDVFFASEINTLKTFVETRLSNLKIITETFAYKTRRAQITAFENICEVPPGNVLIKTKSGIEFKTFQYQHTKRVYSKSQNVELRNQITAAVERWCQSDVPVTLSLSGGLDSSIIAYTVSNELSMKIPSYTFGIKGQQSEIDIARKTADKFNINLKEVEIDEEELACTIPEMVRTIGEPYCGDIPAWFIYRQVHRDKKKVILTGTGADELFGNYGKSKITVRKIARWVRYYNLKFRNLNNLRFCLTYFPNYLPQIRELDLFRRKISIDEEYFEPNKPIEDAIYSYDKRTQLANEFLLITDRFSSKFSVEARTPFLDQELEHYVLNHTSDRFKHMPFKFALRETYKNVLPKEIMHPKKVGFTTSNTQLILKYLHDDVHYYFNEEFIKYQGIFNYNAINTILERVKKSDSRFEYFFWSIFVFQIMWSDENSIS